MDKSKIYGFGMLALLLTIVAGFAYADGDAQRIRGILFRCETDTGVRISINSNDYDTRTPRRQAELMADMSPEQRVNLYKNADYVQEMNKCTMSSRADKINHFERLIREALSRDRKVSSHLSGDALDISPPPSNKQTLVRQWLEQNGVTVLDETNNGIYCWHLQLR